MNELIIKSKMLSMADYTSVDLTEHLPKFYLDRNKLEADIKRVQYANGTKLEADTVEKGDLVLISCKSEHPHYQKDDIYLIVGKNLYSAEFEEKLVGLSKAENQIIVENSDVTVDIKSIVRTTIPALTDENVKMWGLDGVDTAEGLRRYYFNRQVDAFRDEDEDADMVFTILCNEVTNNSTFECDEEELQAIKKIVDLPMQKAKIYRDELLAAGEELDENWDLDALVKSMTEQTLKAAAIGYTLLKEQDSLLTLDDYSNELKKRAEFMQQSVDETAQRYSQIDYAIECYSQYFFDLLDDYAGKFMKDYYYQFSQKVDVYDVAVIGAGPAGLSAALTLKLHNKTIVWFGADSLSDKIEKSEKIANYAGFEPISGRQLNEAFKKQIQTAELELTDKMVTQISQNKNEYMVLADNEIYNAKTVLLTIGAVPAKGITNEQELLGHGVSYCATCDGFLYKGKTIAVFCSAKKYEHEVEYLAEIADKVYLYTSYDDVNISLPNVEILEKPMKAVLGESKVEGIELTDGTEVSVDGAFFLRSSVAPATILKGLEMDGAHIVVNRNCETNIPGCFAAGDCTGRPYQIAKAVGEGNVAAHKIVEYLAEEK